MALELDTNTDPSLSRRLMLQVPMALGFGLAGISGSAHAAKDPVLATRSSAKPQRGGTLMRSMPGDPPNFDIFSNTTGRVIFVAGPCYNGVVRFDEFDATKVVPDLAESWQVSADGLEYSFQLRSGVKFHDGKPMTSTDVQFTFDTMRNPPAGTTSVRSALLDAVDRIETPSPTVVRFVLKRKSPGFLPNLASGWMVVLPKHILEKGPMKDVIVGTGPFKFKEYKRGTSIELVRNPDYHVPGKPYLDGVKTFMIPDRSTEFSYFRTGQIDTVDSSAPHLALQWEKELKSVRKDAFMVAGPSQSSLNLFFNSQQKPWDDVRVRQAACLAIDREQVLTTLLKGEGVLGGWACPGPWALPASELEKIPGYGKYTDANLVKAKQLLAEAGFPNGFKETMVVRRSDLFTSFAILVQERLSRVGIDITLDLQETAAFVKNRNTRNFKLNPDGRTFATNDPDAFFGDSVTCTGGTNYASLCDPKLDELYTRASEEMDAKKRLALSREIEKIVLKGYGSFPVLWRNQYRFYQKNIHGWAKHPQEDNSTRLEDCWKSKA